MGKRLKKTVIVSGAVLGALIGGTVGIIGKVAKKKGIEDLGDNIIDSTILTGEIAGDVVSGTVDAISGKVNKDKEKTDDGKSDLKGAASKVGNNIVRNLKGIGADGKEIACGVVKGDKKRIKKGAEHLVKMATIGVITVGAINIKDENENENTSKNRSEEENVEV